MAPRLTLAEEFRSPLDERLIKWDSLGWHWTGSSVQDETSKWLASSASNFGLRTEIQTFAFARSQVDTCFIQSDQVRTIGLPLFNHAATPPGGIVGRLARSPGEGDIALLQLPPQAHAEEALRAAMEAKTGAPYRAAVIVTTGASPGLAPLDCVMMRDPLPVIQVPSDAFGWLDAAREKGSPVTLLAQMSQDEGVGRNVIALRGGTDQTATPLVIATGYSGWGPCVGERGGPVSIWLQLAAALGTTPPQRSVVLLAADGEELGGLGRSAFLTRFAELAPHALGWLELGANLGARDSALELVAQDNAWSRLLARRLEVEGIRFKAKNEAPLEISERIATRVALHASPAPQFHLPADQLPSAVNLVTLSGIGAAVARTVAELAQN
jgi:hypothetical protein